MKRMKRMEILGEFKNLTVDQHEYLIEVLNHFESKFNSLADLLDVSLIEELGNIHEARSIAEDCSRDLY